MDLDKQIDMLVCTDNKGAVTTKKSHNAKEMY